MNHHIGNKLHFRRGLGYVCLPTLLALFFYWGGLGAYFNSIDLWDIRFTLDDNYSKFPPVRRPVRYALLYLVYLGFGLDSPPYRILFLIPYICLLTFFYHFYNLLSNNKALSLIAVLLFASFYLNSDTVITLILHHELLMAMFILAALVCFCYYRKTQSRRYYVLTLLSTILASLSKEAAVVLPLFLLAVDYHVSYGIFPPRQVPFKTIGRYLLPHLPFWFVALVTALYGRYGENVGNFFYIIPGHDAGMSYNEYLNSTYWYIIYTLSPCFITDRLTIILAFSIMVGLGWLFYHSSPQGRSLIVTIVVCWGSSLIPHIPRGVVTRYMFLPSIFTMFLVALLASAIGLFLHRLLERRLKGYHLSPDLTAVSFALLLILPAIYLNYKYIRQFAQDVVYAGALTREVVEGTIKTLPQRPGVSQIIYINLPSSVFSKRPHCVTQSQFVFYQAALDLHYRQLGIKLTSDTICNNTKAVFVDLGYSHVKLASDAWYNIKTELEKAYWWMPEISREEYSTISKDERNKLLFFNPLSNKLVDVSGWSYEKLEGSVAPHRDKLNHDPPNFLP